MAFLDHIDPGNSGGSVRIPDRVKKSPFKPMVYTCSNCGKIFKEKSVMQEHRIEEHPIQRPMLLIDDQPLRKENLTIRTKILAKSIKFKNVDAVYVNNELVEDQQKLIEWLCSSTPVVFQLRLVNQNYPVEYRWNIDIADSAELDEVDSQFYNIFDTGLDISAAFSLFNERVRKLSSAARNYAAGLSCYVTAVITKDQLPGATLPYEKYSHKLGEALDILSDYKQRPLTEAIIAIAEFMQSDFRLLPVDNKLPKLDATKRLFNNGIFVDVVSTEFESRSIPIDNSTSSIISFCSGTELTRKSHIRDVEVIHKSAHTDVRDKLKATFILWCFYGSLKNTEKINELRSMLIHNPYFGELVEAIEGY